MMIKIFDPHTGARIIDMTRDPSQLRTKNLGIYDPIIRKSGVIGGKSLLGNLQILKK